MPQRANGSVWTTRSSSSIRDGSLMSCGLTSGTRSSSTAGLDRDRRAHRPDAPADSLRAADRAPRWHPAGVVAAIRHDSLINRLLMLFALDRHGHRRLLPRHPARPALRRHAQVATVRRLRSLPRLAGRSARSMLLPSLALGVSIAGLPARLIRASMLDVLHEDYIRAAIARGISPANVATRHALRNALMPAVTVLGSRSATCSAARSLSRPSSTCRAWANSSSTALPAATSRSFRAL